MKKCQRCLNTQGSNIIRTYTRNAKTKNEQVIHICDECILLVFYNLVNKNRIDFDKLIKYAKREIGSWEL